MDWLLTAFRTECKQDGEEKDGECEGSEDDHSECEFVFLSLRFLGAGSGIENFGESSFEARGVVVWQR